jgi:hypothetical protein
MIAESERYVKKRNTNMLLLQAMSITFDSIPMNISKFLLVSIFAFASLLTRATEGMWIPSMIKQLVEDDMQNMGLKISAEDLYSINHSSIKDAVVHFNGGCTSVLVSSKGLLLTNHHCGYSRIQAHSSLEHNYLEDGFWAATLKDELSNPDMVASIIKEIKDVTEDLLGELPENATEEERAAMVLEKSNILIKSIELEGQYEAYIKPFYYGNQYLLFITEVFKDVRLVGAPPSSIGKYGYDTDNWVWPRHTGDFSVFRIYANKDNKPAAYSEDNIPYKPEYALPISLAGVDEDDFTLVYGFPGRTENYITSDAVEEAVEEINPLRIKMREASLSIIDAAMRKDPLIKIQYAAKQSRISNAYKKWIGQSKGLIRNNAIAQKDSLEVQFQKLVNANPEYQEKYGSLLLNMSSLGVMSRPFRISREYFIELYYMGPEILRYTENFRELVEMSKDKTKTDDEINAWVEAHKNGGFFKNYNAEVDKAIMKAQLPYFVQGQRDFVYFLGLKKSKESLDDFVDRLYSETMFASEAKMNDMLNNYKRSHYKKIENDLAYLASKNIYDHYFMHTRPILQQTSEREEQYMREWMAAQMEILPEKSYYPDANGTLRITFGKVEGYEPFNGAYYSHYTTLEGVLEKEDPTNPEYNLPPKLRELYEGKDYGQYADSTGEMRVCFIASNHTSGGNSGSPVFNANGELIGLNFDRTWESTMSDIMFDPKICRNISVDIRYVLFIIDQFAGAGHLVQEMDLRR